MAINNYDLNKAERDIRGLGHRTRILTDEVLTYEGKIARLEQVAQGAYESTPPSGAHDRKESYFIARDAKRKELTEVVAQLERYGQKTSEFLENKKADLNEIGTSSQSVKGRYQKGQYEHSRFYLECDKRRGDALYAEARNAVRYAARVAPTSQESGTSSHKTAINEAVRNVLASSSPEYVPNTYADLLAAYSRHGHSEEHDKTQRGGQRPLLGKGKSPKVQNLSDKIMAGMGSHQATNAATYAAIPSGSYDPVERNEYGLRNSQRR